MRFANIQLWVVMCAVGVTAGQYLIFNDSITWENTTTIEHRNYASPLNWSEGRLFRRIEVKSKPTDLKMGAKLCVSGNGETCSGCQPFFTKAGTYYRVDTAGLWSTSSGSPYEGWDVHGLRGHILIDGTCDKWIATSGGWCTAGSEDLCMGPSAAQHLPVSIHFTEYYVDPGEGFDCPDDWMDAPLPGCAGTAAVAGSPQHGGRTEGGIQVEFVSPHRLALRLPGPGKVSLYSPNGDRLAVAEAGPSGLVCLKGLTGAADLILVKAEGEFSGALSVFMP